MEPLLNALRAMGLFESDVVEERPWGLWVDWYRTPEATLKCMVVKPGARMSLQKHGHRQEVWRTISGEGEDQGTSPPTPLRPGHTHVVKIGATHRIANTGKEPLVIVELQMGECREDDIVRIADDYQRDAKGGHAKH
jgi:mannose-6-phosphate isomerase-like protein (cupin superfamily)